MIARKIKKHNTEFLGEKRNPEKIKIEKTEFEKNKIKQNLGKIRRIICDIFLGILWWIESLKAQILFEIESIATL